MEPFTFDQIPVMINKIHDKLEHLEKLILRISNAKENKEEEELTPKKHQNF